MHTNDAKAPPAGTLVYCVNEDNFDPTYKDHAFCVLHIGTQVKVVKIKDPPSNGTSAAVGDYDPEVFTEHMGAALARALARSEVKLRRFEAHTSSMKKAVETLQTHLPIATEKK